MICVIVAGDGGVPVMRDVCVCLTGLVTEILTCDVSDCLVVAVVMTCDTG